MLGQLGRISASRRCSRTTRAVVTAANDRRYENDMSSFNLDIPTMRCGTTAAAAGSSVPVSIQDYEHERIQDEKTEEVRMNV